MAIVRKTLDALRAERRTIDRAKIAAATDDDIRRQAIEDGEDASLDLDPGATDGVWSAEGRR